jgi:hypothetical protein
MGHPQVRYTIRYFNGLFLIQRILASPTQTTLATKKRQAITGIKQKASTAHSSITTTLMN